MAIIKHVENTDHSILEEIYKDIEKSAKTVPEWAKVMAHRPEILGNFWNLLKSIMYEGELDTVLKWKIAYTVSQILKCQFCIDITRKMLTKFGLEADINFKEASDEEKEILEIAKEITINGYLTGVEKVYELTERMGESKVVEIASVIGLFNYINRFNNLLAILPE